MKQSLRRRLRYFALLLVVLFLTGIAALKFYRPTVVEAQDKQTVEMSESAAKQILSLIQEKESRTPAQRKIDSQLLYAIKEDKGEAITSRVRTLEVNIPTDATGLVAVDITADVTKELLRGIENLGGEVIYSNEDFRAIRARLPLQSIERVAGNDEVTSIRPADSARTNRIIPEASGKADSSKNVKPSDAKMSADFAARAARVRSQLPNLLPVTKAGKAAVAAIAGAVVTQGDRTHRADEARANFGVTGAGVKIGVLSDGVDSAAASTASGELSPVTILPGQAGSGDEGTAMLEIIHDLAPGAQLFFATAFTSQASFAQNILDLRTAGCDIIVDDVGYFREAVFQDDDVARSVNTVTASGGLYFSSAGNEGNKNDGTSGVWEGDFVDGGTLSTLR